MYPANLNFKMPPEWVQHERTFISWPVKSSLCHPENYDAVCQGYAEIIEAIAEFEPVTILANPADMDKLSSLFKNPQVQYLNIEHNDAWLRDNGPTFLLDESGEIAGVNWHFNAWGGKYSAWDLDEQVAPKILDHFDVRRFNAPLIMEGGSLHVDGESTLLTTAQCLLNPNRNPMYNKAQIEVELKQYLGISKVIWLNNGLFGDETDGHVDNVACFAGPAKILIQVCNDPSDENYEITRQNLSILREKTDALGRNFEIIPIQQPPKRYNGETRLTLSYLNFYFVNGGIILPIFGGQAQETDRLAIEVLKETFPDRRIRTVNGMGIIREGGNVHCTTQQMPMGNKKKG